MLFVFLEILWPGDRRKEFECLNKVKYNNIIQFKITIIYKII